MEDIYSYIYLLRILVYNCTVRSTFRTSTYRLSWMPLLYLTDTPLPGTAIRVLS